MRINRNNYESFLVDYSEGVLSADLKQEVENFLLLNPDIKEEFEIFSSEFIEITPENFPEKDKLKKIPFHKTAVSSNYFQELCIAHIEGLLPESDEKFLAALVREDNQKQMELAAFEKAKLIIENLNFDEKILLKQAKINHTISHSNFEEYCIACMEGWLDQAGLVKLNEFIKQHPNQNQILQTYYKTRLTPDFSIVYPDKKKIKRFTILTPNFKKYISIASSVAAILVFGFMVYYTTTLDNTAQLTGNVSNVFIEKPSETKTPESDNLIKHVETSSTAQNVSIIHDPFGFEKISGKELQSVQTGIVNERIVVDHIQPIRFTQIECPPCKQVFEKKSLAKTEWVEKTHLENGEKENSSQQSKMLNTDDKPAWVLAQAGIAGFNKITNTEIKVEKNRERNKTKIAFNSKLFSFSTQVNNN